MEKLTTGELFYLRNLAEADAHDGEYDIAKFVMGLVKKLDKMLDEGKSSHYAIYHKEEETVSSND